MRSTRSFGKGGYAPDGFGAAGMGRSQNAPMPILSRSKARYPKKCIRIYPKGETGAVRRESGRI